MRSHDALIIREAPSDAYKGSPIVRIPNEKRVHGSSFNFILTLICHSSLNATSRSLVTLKVALIRLPSRHQGIDMDLSSWCLAFSGKRDYLQWPKSSRLFRVIPLLIVQIEKVFIVNLAACLGPDNQIWGVLLLQFVLG